MLVPKRVKHRREFRGKMRGAAKGGRNVDFGEYGLEALESHWLTNRRIRIFPHKSYTSKGVGVRMGNGKGAPTGWVAVVKREKIMFEVGGVSEAVAKEALRLASNKLPIRTKIVSREEVGGQSNEG